MCLVCPYQSLYVCKPPASWWYAPIVTSAGLRTTNALVTQDLTRSKGRVSELQVTNADLAKRLAESQAVASQLQDSLHLSRSQGNKQAEVGLSGAVSACSALFLVAATCWSTQNSQLQKPCSSLRTPNALRCVPC